MLNCPCNIGGLQLAEMDVAFVIDIESTGLRVLVNQGGSTNVTVCDPGSVRSDRLFFMASFCVEIGNGTTYRAFLDGALEGSATGNACTYWKWESSKDWL